MSNRAVFTFELVDRTAGGDGASAGGGTPGRAVPADTRTPQTRQQDAGSAALGGSAAAVVVGQSSATASRALETARRTQAVQAGAAVAPLAGQALGRLGGAAGFGAAGAGVAGLAAVATPAAAAGGALAGGIALGTAAAARGLGEVSPDVARALAQADAARIQADLAAGQKFGPRFAGVVEAQGGLSREFSELGRNVAGLASGEVGGHLAILTEILGRLNQGLEFIDGISRWVPSPPGSAATVAKTLEHLGVIRENTAKNAGTDLATWWESQGHIQPDGGLRAGGRPADVEFAPVLGLELP